METYNYSGTTVNYALHFTLDMLSYYNWGNAEKYPAGEARSVKDFYANQEAQDAYNEIKEHMESD